MKIKKLNLKSLCKYKVGKRKSRIELFIPPPRTSSGKTQFQCPSKNCSKVFYIEKKDDFIEQTLTCPYCGIYSSEDCFILKSDKSNAVARVFSDFRNDSFNEMKKEVSSPKFKKTLEKYLKNEDNLSDLNPVLDLLEGENFGFAANFIINFLAGVLRTDEETLIDVIIEHYKIEGRLKRIIKEKPPKLWSISKKTMLKIIELIKSEILKEKSLFKTIEFNINEPILLHFRRTRKNDVPVSSIQFSLGISLSINMDTYKSKDLFSIDDFKVTYKTGAKRYLSPMSGCPNTIFGIDLSFNSPPENCMVVHEDKLRNIKCNRCSLSYGVPAIAFFCPFCGCSNLEVNFYREIELAKKLIKKIDSERDEELRQKILRSAHKEILSSFEAYLKNIFMFIQKNNISNKKQINFQNIQEVKKKYRTLGINPFEQLSDQEYSDLLRYVQMRHPFTHNLGVVDEKYRNGENEHELGNQF